MSPDTDQGYTPGSATSQQLSTTKQDPPTQKRPHEGRVNIQDERPSKRSLVMTGSGKPEQGTQIDDGFILPQPEFRNVAGDVRRRTDQVPVAEPPPTNRPRIQSSQQRSSQKKPRRRQGLGGDGASSESESENSDRKRNHGTGSTRARRPRQPKFSPKPSGSSRSVMQGLTEEEQQRVDIMRAMSRIENDWPDTRAQRQDAQGQNDSQKRNLEFLHEKRWPPQADSHTRQIEDAIWRVNFRGFISNSDQQRRHFLNHGYINHELDQATNDARQLWENSPLRTLERVEIGLLRRCDRFFKKFDIEYPRWQSAQCSGEGPRDRMQFHLRAIVVTMSRQHWERKYRGVQSDLLIDYIKSPSKEDGNTLLTDTLVDKYIGKIVVAVEYASNEDFVIQQQTLADFYGLFERSCQPPRRDLNVESNYIDWIFSDMHLAEIGIHRPPDATPEGHGGPQSSHSVESTFVQEKTTMLLVVVKGGTVTSIKQVSAESLPKMGWFLDEQERYYRCEVDIQTGSIFRVDVDGQVLGMCVGMDRFLECE